MKKDIFNGKIRTEFRSWVIFTLVFTAVVGVACGLLFLFIAIFDDYELVAKAVFYGIAALSMLGGIGYSVATLCLIRIYPQHKRITLRFIKEFVFRETDTSSDDRYKR